MIVGYYLFSHLSHTWISGPYGNWEIRNVCRILLVGLGALPDQGDPVRDHIVCLCVLLCSTTGEMFVEQYNFSLVLSIRHSDGLPSASKCEFCVCIFLCSGGISL